MALELFHYCTMMWIKCGPILKKKHALFALNIISLSLGQILKNIFSLNQHLKNLNKIDFIDEWMTPSNVWRILKKLGDHFKLYSTSQKRQPSIDFLSFENIFSTSQELKKLNRINQFYWLVSDTTKWLLWSFKKLGDHFKRGNSEH